jgi:hypothetical protein
MAPSTVIHVALVNGVSGEEYTGECKFWLGGRGNPTVPSLDSVVLAIWDFNPGGLQSLFIKQDMLLETWQNSIMFFLPDTLVPLDRSIDLTEHIVRDDNGCNWLTLTVIKKQQ